MSISDLKTDASREGVDGVVEAFVEAEEQVRERIEDAIRALDRYEPINAVNETDEATMQEGAHGDYLSREAVLEACKRGAW
jgi:hypothetical protein